jgi:hypothetical protein
MIDHDVASYGHIVKLFVDGEPYGYLTRDDVLDNITLCWLTNTGVSSARLYVEYKNAFFNDYNISVPTAVSVDRARLPQSHPLQRAPRGRPLCGLGTAEALHRGTARGLQITAPLVEEDVLSPQTMSAGSLFPRCRGDIWAESRAMSASGREQKSANSRKTTSQDKIKSAAFAFQIDAAH